MASAKEVQKKIRTTANTKKITSTMEMVATARSKRAQNRVQAATPYSTKLNEILSSLAGAGSIAHPLLEDPGEVKKTLLLVVTANRGLCGGYNSNVLSMAEKLLAAEREAGREVEVYMIGKKGIGRFRFLGESVAQAYTDIEDQPTFADAQGLADIFMRRYLAGEAQRVLVISTRYLTSSLQRAAQTQLLPIPPAELEDGSDGGGGEDFIFEPDRETILANLLPLSITQVVYQALLDAAVSEQLARRIAMKLATDSADDMIKMYTQMYNRQRQAGITQQITEIVGGAQALE